jgi:hypothetical protein
MLPKIVDKTKFLKNAVTFLKIVGTFLFKSHEVGWWEIKSYTIRWVFGGLKVCRLIHLPVVL